MPHIIAEPCIGTKDTACVDVCPVDCIHPTKDAPNYEAADQLFIAPDTCIDCGLCVDECPVSAIYQDEDLPKEWDNYVQLNIDYFKDQRSAVQDHPERRSRDPAMDPPCPPAKPATNRGVYRRAG